MKRLLKKYGWILIIIIIVTFLLLLPVFINWCYTIPSWDEIFEKPQEWTEFWGTYLSAIASFAMVLMTLKTLKQNREQLNEIKRQWKEQNQPFFKFNIVIIRSGEVCLNVSNAGMHSIYNAKIKFGQHALSVIQDEGIDLSNLKNEILDNGLTLGIQSNRVYSLFLWRETGYFDYLDITVIYEDGRESNHIVDLLLPISEYQEKKKYNGTEQQK